jgi:MbtH protein
MNLAKGTEYSVVINHEEQYSIWPKKLALQKGWKRSKVNGSLYSCMKHIEEVWTDMRPLSIQKRRLPKKN